MRKRDPRRQTVIPPEWQHAQSIHISNNFAWSYYQSYMLLYDAAHEEVMGKSFPISRFVPSALIILHAYIDAQLNELSNVKLHRRALAANVDDATVKNDRIFIRLSLSSHTQKHRRAAKLLGASGEISEVILGQLDLLFDLRDMIFHSETAFHATNEFNIISERACREAGVELTGLTWSQHISDIRILMWSHQVAKFYFSELSILTGNLDPLGRTIAGQFIQYINESTGAVSFDVSREEEWRRLRSQILPSFYRTVESGQG